MYLYYTGTPPLPCIPGGAGRCSGDTQAWQGMTDPQAALCPSTGEGSARSFLWGDVQMNSASSILHCCISSNRFDSCFAKWKWAKLSGGDSRKHHKQWKLKPNSFVSKKGKNFQFLQNSWIHYEGVLKFLLSKVHAWERSQSKDKTHLKMSFISEG